MGIDADARSWPDGVHESLPRAVVVRSGPRERGAVSGGAAGVCEGESSRGTVGGYGGKTHGNGRVEVARCSSCGEDTGVLQKGPVVFGLPIPA